MSGIMIVRDIMSRNVKTVRPDDTALDAVRKMNKFRIGSVIVVNSGRPVGIITERDVVRTIAQGADPEEEAVSDWMSDAPDTFSPDVEVEEAAAWLLEIGYRHMPVMDEGELLGVVSLRDILAALISPDE